MNVREKDTLKFKIDVLERVMTAIARRNTFGPYTSMRIVSDAVLKHLKSSNSTDVARIPIEHKSIRIAEARDLENAELSEVALKEHAIKRAANRDLIQAAMCELMDEQKLSFQETQFQIMLAVEQQRSDYLTAEVLSFLKIAGVNKELDLDYVLTQNRIDAIEYLLNHTDLNAKAAFAYINKLSGRQISDLPVRLSNHIDVISRNVRNLYMETGETDVNILVGDIKALIAAKKLGLDKDLTNLVLTERLKASLQSDIELLDLKKIMDKTMDSYFKTTLSQSYSVAQSITQTFGSWVNCITGNHCPQIIPLRYASLRAPKDDINALFAIAPGKTKLDDTLINLAETLVESYHVSMSEVVDDMIRMASGGKSLYGHVGQYEAAFKTLKVKPGYLRILFSKSVGDGIVSATQARILDDQTQSILGSLMTYILLQPHAERLAVFSKVSDWIGCYLQDKCVGGLLDGSSLWEAASNAMQIAAPKPSTVYPGSAQLAQHVGHDAQSESDLSKEFMISCALFGLAILPFAKLGYDYCKNRLFKAVPANRKLATLTSIQVSDVHNGKKI